MGFTLTTVHCGQIMYPWTRSCILVRKTEVADSWMGLGSRAPAPASGHPQQQASSIFNLWPGAAGSTFGICEDALCKELLHLLPSFVAKLASLSILHLGRVPFAIPRPHRLLLFKNNLANLNEQAARPCTWRLQQSSW